MARRRSRSSRVSRKRSRISRKRSRVSMKRSRVSRKHSRVLRKRSRVSRKNRKRKSSRVSRNKRGGADDTKNAIEIKFGLPERIVSFNHDLMKWRGRVETAIIDYDNNSTSIKRLKTETDEKLRKYESNVTERRANEAEGLGDWINYRIFI